MNLRIFGRINETIRILAKATIIAFLPLLLCAVTPNDPRFNAQWYLKKIGATNVWTNAIGSRDIVVATIDTGVNYNNPDLAANMWRNPGETGLDANGKDKATNGMDDDANGYVDDVHGINTFTRSGDPMDLGFVRGAITTPYTHGTASAGVIGAVGNNSLGSVGVNWEVSIMGIRIGPLNFEKDWDDRKVVPDVAEAFRYVAEMKRRGVNIVATSSSWAVAPYSRELEDAVEECGKLGILNVVSAGNNGANNDQIGWYFGGFQSPSIICVAASLQNDTLATWSCYGKSTVHLAAPGENLVTTEHDDYCCTSGATPQVSGAVALLKSAVPTATDMELKAAILGSTDQLPSMNGKLVSNGRLNIAKALARLRNPVAPAIVVAALPAGPRVRPHHNIQVTFSRAMDRASVETALSFNPTINGRFQWENDRTFTFIPDSPLVHTNYTGTIPRTALDLEGTRLDGNYNGVLQDSNADDFKWTFGFPLPNDDLADPVAISGDTGSQRGTTRNATREIEEPEHAADRRSSPSVWYEWAAPGNGWFTFELASTAFDTLLAVYEGTNYATLREIASNDNYGTRLQSRTSFETVGGRSYSIAVASKSGEVDKFQILETAVGPFTLNWQPTPSPGFTGSRFSPSSGAPNRTVTLTGTNFTGATAVLFNGVSAGFTNAAGNNADVRIIAVVPAGATSGPITVITPHGSVTSSTSFTVIRPELSLRHVSTNDLELSWTDPNQEYRLESSTELQTWSLVTEQVTSVAGVCKVRILINGGRHFYRLRKL